MQRPDHEREGDQDDDVGGDIVDGIGEPEGRHADAVRSTYRTQATTAGV